VLGIQPARPPHLDKAEHLTAKAIRLITGEEKSYSGARFLVAATPCVNAVKLSRRVKGGPF
jgi:hypothetical protein